MKYRQITFEERYTLGLLRRQGLTPAAIARVLGRHRSSIARELQRNRTPRDDAYRPQLADWYARGRRSRSRRNRRFSPADRDRVAALVRRTDASRTFGGRHDPRGRPVGTLRLEPSRAQDRLRGPGKIAQAHSSGGEPARGPLDPSPAAPRANHPPPTPAPSSTATQPSSGPPQHASISRHRTTPGNEEPARTPTACCANTCRRGRVWLTSPNTTAIASPPS
jgi:hypothetical protein